MKFLVSDKQPERHNRIRSFLTADTAIIAALLAAVDLDPDGTEVGNRGAGHLSPSNQSGNDEFKNPSPRFLSNRSQFATPMRAAETPVRGSVKAARTANSHVE